MPLRRPWRPRLLGGLALAGAVLVLVGTTPGTLLAGRRISTSEQVYYFFAHNLGEPRLCERISWAAFSRYSVMFGGGGASYDRSDCYERVAEARGDPSLCWRARPLVDLDPLSSGHSAWSCRRATRASHQIVTSLDDADLVRTFDRLGYDIDQVRIDDVVPPAIRPRDVYVGLAHDPAVVARAAQWLTSPDRTLSVDDARYLAEFSAVASGDPRFCESLPQAGVAQDAAAPSRDTCYLEIAYNTNDVRLCGRMTPAAQDPAVQEALRHGMREDLAVQLGLRGECLRIPRRVGPVHPYVPAVPTDDARTLRLLAALQVPVPRARDWPDSEKAAYWRNFLAALWPKRPAYPGAVPPPTTAREQSEEAARDAARDQARRLLVERLEALPTDTGGARS